MHLHWPGQPASHKRKKAYQIGRHIGEGGYGEVKSAVCLETGREVAIKIVPKTLVKDHVMQIARMTKLLTFQHPHVVKLYEWFESSSKYYMVFELARYGELYDNLMGEARGRYPEAKARATIKSLVQAVEYLHREHSILHRDIKLENVLLRSHRYLPDGSADVVLSDFGLAARGQPEELFDTVCGSAGYGAPEIYLSEGYTQLVDEYAVGVVAFALLGGRFPYKSTEPMALAREARTRDLYFPPSTWSTISEEAKDFVAGLLRPFPTERMTAAQALSHPWLQVEVPHEPVGPEPELEGGMIITRQKTHVEDPREADQELVLKRERTSELHRVNSIGSPVPV